MPYITPERRRTQWYIGGNLEDITVGDINYQISTLCNAVLRNKGLSYSNINGLIGVLECVKMELYRRIAVPYENVKLAENGDVYDIYTGE